jgi:hypothetical protein
MSTGTSWRSSGEDSVSPQIRTFTRLTVPIASRPGWRGTPGAAGFPARRTRPAH